VGKLRKTAAARQGEKVSEVNGNLSPKKKVLFMGPPGLRRGKKNGASLRLRRKKRKTWALLEKKSKSVELLGKTESGPIMEPGCAKKKEKEKKRAIGEKKNWRKIQITVRAHGTGKTFGGGKGGKGPRT